MWLAEIYCPYPVMAQLAAQALNLQTDDPRGWTITGAHMSHGAPGAGCEWPPRLAPRSSGYSILLLLYPFGKNVAPVGG